MKSDEEFNRGKAPSYYVRSTVRVGLRVHPGVSPGNSFWGADFGLNAPRRALFQHKRSLQICICDLKPHDSGQRRGHQSLVEADGDAAASWGSGGKALGDIYRTSGLTKRHPHTVDVYSKDGGIPGYLSRFVLVDEYEIGIVALTAGPKGVLDSVTEAAMSLFVEAADEETRKQAQVYVGNFDDDYGCGPCGGADGHRH